MKIAIIGSGMMGSALAFPARENGNTVRLVGTPLDREIIDECRKTNRHPKFAKHFPKGMPPFPEGCEFYQIEEMEKAIEGVDFVIGGVSSFGVDWAVPGRLRVLPDRGDGGGVEGRGLRNRRRVELRCRLVRRGGAA